MSPKNHFSISERKLILRLFDVVFVCFGAIGLTTFFNIYEFTFDASKLITWLLSLTAYILFFGQIFEMYDLKTASDRFLFTRSAGLTAFFSVIAYVLTPIVAPELPEQRIHIVYLFLTIFVMLLIWRFLYITLIFKPRFFKQILLIGDNDELKTIIDVIEEKALDHKIEAYISPAPMPEYPHLKWIEYQPKILLNTFGKDLIANEIVVSNLADEVFKTQINNELAYLFEQGVVIKSMNHLYQEITQRVPRSQLTNRFYEHFTFSKHHENNLYLALVRVFDILFSLFGLLIMTLFIPIIFFGNLFANKGPLFYKQQRVGQKGKLINILKFRTMVTNAEKDGAVWAQKNDSRITPFGRFLRKTRLDELPQFYNVLIGEMSVIGPRPERPQFVNELEEKFPFYAIRHVVKPGLTGWAQVMHPYASTYDEQHIKLCYDLFYIKNRGLFLDFKIFIKTISTVLFFKGS